MTKGKQCIPWSVKLYWSRSIYSFIPLLWGANNVDPDLSSYFVLLYDLYDSQYDLCACPVSIVHAKDLSFHAFIRKRNQCRLWSANQICMFGNYQGLYHWCELFERQMCIVYCVNIVSTWPYTCACSERVSARERVGLGRWGHGKLLLLLLPDKYFTQFLWGAN